MLLKVQKSKHKPKCCPSVVLIYILRYPTYKKYVNINGIYGSTCTMLVIMYRTYHDFRLYYFNGAFKGEKRLVQL